MALILHCRKMTPEDVYGVDAQRRYMIDRFLVKPSEANVDMLTQVRAYIHWPHVEIMIDTQVLGPLCAL
eukprot:853412-Amphidinium_carterae.2